MTVKGRFLEIHHSLPSIISSNFSYLILVDCISERPSRSMSTRHDRILASEPVTGKVASIPAQGATVHPFLWKQGPLTPESMSPN